MARRCAVLPEPSKPNRSRALPSRAGPLLLAADMTLRGRLIVAAGNRMANPPVCGSRMRLAMRLGRECSSSMAFSTLLRSVSHSSAPCVTEVSGDSLVGHSGQRGHLVDGCPSARHSSPRKACRPIENLERSIMTLPRVRLSYRSLFKFAHNFPLLGRISVNWTPLLRSPVRFAAIGLDHAHVFGMIGGLLTQAPSSWASPPTTPRRRSASRSARCSPTCRGSTTRGPCSTTRRSTSSRPRPSRSGAARSPSRPCGRQGRHHRQAGRRLLEQLRTSRSSSPRRAASGRRVLGAVRREGRGQGRRARPRGPDRSRRADPRPRPSPRARQAHLAGGSGRPDWFYDLSTYGGILNDIASHQIDQFLWFTGLGHGRRGLRARWRTTPTRTIPTCRTSAT